jgi:hypothetical protein
MPATVIVVPSKPRDSSGVAPPDPPVSPEAESSSSLDPHAAAVMVTASPTTARRPTRPNCVLPMWSPSAPMAWPDRSCCRRRA